MNITLIGFMASGKSTLAIKMAKESGKKLICLDKEIENDEEKSIPEIFKSYGEDYFRSLEREKLLKVLKEDNVIIDCGGGAAIYNQDLIRDNSYVIFIDTDFETIWERLTNDTTRPLRDSKTKEQMKHLYDNRREIYRRICNEIVN